MDVIWGIVIVALGLLAWAGQLISWSAPTTAVRLGLVEAEDSVEGVYWADIRGEALWDAFTLWTLPLAGLLLIAGHEAWIWLGLVGGGIYVYFGGRGVLTRLELRRRGHRIGDPENVRVGLAALVIWGLVGLVTIAAAIGELA
jgi:hypothetical protein